MGRYLYPVFLLLILTYFPGKTQNLTTFQTTTNVWLNGQFDKSEKLYLYHLGDSSIFFVENSTVFSPSVIEYPVTDVYTLHLRRKGNIGTGILLGAATGFLVNGLVDLLRQRHTQSACAVCPLLEELETRRGPNRQRYIGGMVIGGVVGGVIAGIKLNFSIGGSRERYEYHKSELMRYSLKR